MNKAFVYRLHPTPEQEAILWQWIGAGRWVYNRCLELNKEQYEQDQTFLWYGTKGTGLSYRFKKQWKQEHSWLSDAPAQALHQRMQDFDNALKRVKKGGKGAGFPKFRSRHIEGHNTLRFPHNWTEKNPKGNITSTKRGVWLPKAKACGLGRLRWTKHRPLQGRLKSVTVKRENNRWFAVCLCELADVPPRPSTSEAEVLGIDPGLKTFVVCSDGEKIETPGFSRQQEKKLAGAQRRLSRRWKKQKKGEPQSRNYEKAKRRVNTLHYHIKCRRKDYAHKASTAIAKRARFVGVEDLNVKGMMRNRHMAKRIGDQAMSQFLSLLPYKMEGQGGAVIQADRWYPSSKICSQCGQKKRTLTLNERVYRCDMCGLEINRDLNAALNLRGVALAELRSRGHWQTDKNDACGDTADGAASAYSARAASHVSVKQEIARSAERAGPQDRTEREPQAPAEPRKVRVARKRLKTRTKSEQARQ